MYKLSRGMLLLAVALFACCLVLSAIGAVVLLGPWAPVALLALAVVAACKKSRRLLSAFGTASWASTRDLEQAGMLGADRGLILGRIADDSLWPPGRGIKALLDRRRGDEDACREFLDATSRRRRNQG